MKEKTLDLWLINIASIVFVIIVFSIIIVPYIYIINNGFDSVLLVHPIWFIMTLIVAIFIHELIHGICFFLFAKSGFKAVRFGIKWKSLAPYCHCSEAIKVQQYWITLLMPTIILGFIPTLIGFIINNFTVVVFGCTMIVAGIGDFFGVWLSRDLAKNTIIKDHSTKIGFYYEENNETNV